MYCVPVTPVLVDASPPAAPVTIRIPCAILLLPSPLNLHLHKEAKARIMGLGSNVTDHAVSRVGKSIGHTIKILNDSMTSKASRSHSRRSNAKDMELLLKQLNEESQVFADIPGRLHVTFANFKANPLLYVSIPDTVQWMGQQLQKAITYRW